MKLHIVIDLSCLAPVVQPIRALLVRAWFAVRTWGMHPLHPHAGLIAVRRNTLLSDKERR